MAGKHMRDEGRERLSRPVPKPPRAGLTTNRRFGPLADKVVGYVVRFTPQLRQGVMAASVGLPLKFHGPRDNLAYRVVTGCQFRCEIRSLLLASCDVRRSGSLLSERSGTWDEAERETEARHGVRQPVQ